MKRRKNNLKKIKLSVGVPTFNEERNIGRLLKLILDNFRILEENNVEPIRIIISDCSTDRTLDIINHYRKGNKDLIKLFHHKYRTGLNYAINEIFAHSEGDILVYLNADILMEQDTILQLIRPLMLSCNVGATSPSMIPVMLLKNRVLKGVKYLTARAQVISGLLMDYLRKYGYYIFHGRMFAIRSNIAKHIRIPLTALEQDAFIYNKIVEDGYKVLYVPNARCYYFVGSSLKQYLITSKIYRIGFKQWSDKGLYTEQSFMRNLKFWQNFTRVFIKSLNHDALGLFLFLFFKLLELCVRIDIDKLVKNKFKPIDLSTKV